MKKIFQSFLFFLVLSVNTQFPMDSGAASKALIKPDPAAGAGFPEKQIQIDHCHRCEKIEKVVNPLNFFTCGHTLHLHCQNNFKSHELTIRNCSICTPLTLETHLAVISTRSIRTPEAAAIAVTAEPKTVNTKVVETQAPIAEIEFCAICRENFDPEDRTLRPQTLPCTHTFHKECVNRWFKQLGTQICPICRFEIPENRAIIIGRRVARYTLPIMMLFAVNYATNKASNLADSILAKFLIKYYGNIERERFISPAMLAASSSITTMLIKKKLNSFMSNKGIQLLDRIRGRTLAEDEIQAMSFVTESLNSVITFFQFYSAFSELIRKVVNNRQILIFKAHLDGLANSTE
ncbi:MAG TPA: RING finger domain-containing protein [Candidatus Babeliales bacterium]|nr:RING finger domain-containing protein [Candidatus Babeliales bacterium]